MTSLLLYPPKMKFLYPLQNDVLVGYIVFSMSVILWFRQQIRFLWHNFDSLCPILFKFYILT